MFLPSQNWKLSRNVSNEIMSLWQGLGLDFIRELQVNNFQKASFAYTLSDNLHGHST